eukprot:TRINITY_DN26123_c0_g1_i1.p1 TRINITY_DN26123_c0_g1~~TRINITY_DN26123_c0_g1_i1.p1  ORF type:complete len:108 (-),score=15.11 TRINITY_DN26123_c0_g1_i1:20-343(-)
MEKRRKREEELLSLNIEQPVNIDELKSAVGIFQITLKEREDRITNLTSDLKKSFDENSRINSRVHDLSLKLEELEGISSSKSIDPPRDSATESSVVEVSNNILCCLM